MSRRLVFGSGRLAALMPIGEINGKPIYPICGAEGSEEDSDSDQDSDEDENSEEDNDGDEEDSDSKAKERKATPKRQDRSGTYINSLKKDLRTARKELAGMRDEKRRAELADKSEVERVTAELDDAQKELADVRPKYQELLKKVEIITVSGQLNLSWNDIEDVLGDRKLNAAIEIDDDGEISGVDDALKDLAKRKPHFLAKPDEGDESDEDKAGNANKTKTGASFNGSKGKQKDRQADRDALVKKYGGVLGNMVETGGF